MAVAKHGVEAAQMLPGHLVNAGNSIAARIAMMAMTTSSSIKVKAIWSRSSSPGRSVPRRAERHAAMHDPSGNCPAGTGNNPGKPAANQGRRRRGAGHGLGQPQRRHAQHVPLRPLPRDRLLRRRRSAARRPGIFRRSSGRRRGGNIEDPKRTPPRAWAISSSGTSEPPAASCNFSPRESQWRKTNENSQKRPGSLTSVTAPDTFAFQCARSILLRSILLPPPVPNFAAGVFGQFYARRRVSGVGRPGTKAKSENPRTGARCSGHTPKATITATTIARGRERL
jgi:hypothetical protein